MKGNLLNFIINTIRKFSLSHIHWLGFDLAAGAVISQIAFTKIPVGKATLNTRMAVVLALGVFFISSLNNLLDHRKPAKTESKKYLTNQKERISFLKILIGVLVIASMFAFFLPEIIGKVALGLTVFSAAGIFLFSKLPERSPLHVLREPMSAIILATAILGNTFFQNQELVRENKYAGVLFLLIVIQNFLLSSYFTAIEFPNTSNLATRLSASLSKQILHGITLLVITGCFIICLKTEYRYTQRLIVILLGMSVFQSLILQKGQYINSKKYKKLLVTLILALPFLVL